MAEIVWRGLPEFGLHFVDSQDPQFPALADEVLLTVPPFMVPSESELRRSAVLLNDSGQAIVAIFIRRDYIGESRTHRTGNLTSSSQLEVLSGFTPARDDADSMILPGSKRLVTERSVYGANRKASQGPCGYIGGVAGDTPGSDALAEVSIEFAVLADGLCIGDDPDDFFSALTKAIEVQRTTAIRAAQALREGATEGQVFDILLPLAREAGRTIHSQLPRTVLQMFVRMALHHLESCERDQQLQFFERFAQPSKFNLRRPAE